MDVDLRPAHLHAPRDAPIYGAPSPNDGALEAELYFGLREWSEAIEFLQDIEGLDEDTQEDLEVLRALFGNLQHDFDEGQAIANATGMCVFVCECVSEQSLMAKRYNLFPSTRDDEESYLTPAISETRPERAREPPATREHARQITGIVVIAEVQPRHLPAESSCD